jgi:UDP-N-acetylmuramoyl-tripeptide--D-alanyl-D-alanine ligase
MMRGLLALYALDFPQKIVALYAMAPHWAAYIRRFWTTADMSKVAVLSDYTPRQRLQVRLLVGGMVLQYIGGLACIALAAFRGTAAGWQFGLALLFAVPLVWAHLLPLVAMITWLASPKKAGRALLCTILEWQVQRLRKRHSFKVVAVAGSVGKTSTKTAIARLVQTSLRVRWQEGNYNDRVTVPLIFFGHQEPGIFNIPAWLRIIVHNERAIRGEYPYDVVVAELGTDGPGFMGEFAYVRPDLAIVTAITPEHMEYFGTLDAVAAEELTILDFSETTIINSDDAPSAYLRHKTYQSYGTGNTADYQIVSRVSAGLQGQTVVFALYKQRLTLTIPLLGAQGAKIALAALAAAHALGMTQKAIAAGAKAITAYAGRMQLLPGIRGSMLIDDTYNASPVAVMAALDVLYDLETPQRIALLGNMNELGAYSAEAHRSVGDYCDPTKLDMVLALGPDAIQYLAPAAIAKGCTVKTFTSPYAAGEYIKKHLKKGAVVLAKGSQNRVFAEEAIKGLLADPADAIKLVRQSPYWLHVKKQQFDS